MVSLVAGDELIVDAGLSTVPKLSAGFFAGVEAAGTGEGMLTGFDAAAAGGAAFRGCPAWLCRALGGALVVAESEVASFSLFGLGDCKGEAVAEAGWEC